MFNSIRLYNIKKRIINYCKNNKNDTTKEIWEYLKKNELTYFNYEWFKDYDYSVQYNIETDEEGWKYINYNSHRMYFKKNWDIKIIEEYLNNLLPEQNKKSPHLYFDDNEKKEFYDVVIDAGSAEGLFSLEILDLSKKIYIFEPDEEWVEALKRTFRDYSDKVTIINKFLGDVNKGCYNLSNLIRQEKKIDLIKLDIEGSEIELLYSIKDELKCVSEILVCVYHYQEEEKDLFHFLNNLLRINYSVIIRDGFILFLHDKNQKYPYLRHGVIRVIFD